MAWRAPLSGNQTNDCSYVTVPSLPLLAENFVVVGAPGARGSGQPGKAGQSLPVFASAETGGIVSQAAWHQVLGPYCRR